MSPAAHKGGRHAPILLKDGTLNSLPRPSILHRRLVFCRKLFVFVPVFIHSPTTCIFAVSSLVPPKELGVLGTILLRRAIYGRTTESPAIPKPMMMRNRMLRLSLLLTLSLSVSFAQECSLNGQIFQRGDNLGDAYPLRCGSSQAFPCFCNPDVERQADCPYCGFSAGDGTLHCARDMETISFQDGSIVRVCSCEFPSDPSAGPIRSCTIQTDGLPTPPPVDQSGAGTCIFPDFDGNLVTFQNGESFGDLIEGICGPVDEWPSLCSAPPGGDGNDFFIDYPYCVFDDAVDNFGIVCAKDGEEITYTNIDGNTLTCSCAYSEEDGLQTTECMQVSGGTTPAPVETTTTTTTAPASTPAPVEQPTDDGDGDGEIDGSEPDPEPQETTAPEEPEPKDESGISSPYLYIMRSLFVTIVVQSLL